jgi:hypothetical protein
MPGALLDILDVVEGVSGDHGERVMVDARNAGREAGIQK